MNGIKKIALENVRSHTQTRFDFVAGMNAIVGPNGSGKTTIIESLYAMLRGSSFRGSLLELLRYGEERYQIKLQLEQDGTSLERDLRYLSNQEVSQKKWKINDKTYGRLPSAGRWPVVLFEPNISALITGSPERRRLYLDQLAAQLDIETASSLMKYERVLRQRNKLLKSLTNHAAAPGDTLFIWNTQLAQLAEKIVTARLGLIERLQAQVTAFYQQLGGTDEIVMTYQSSVSNEGPQYGSKLLQFLEASTPRDMILGHTSFGPHRDDLQIRLADQPAHERASRGEVRTVVIALKLLETEILAEHFWPQHIYPTLLMDDVLSELDLVHQERVLAGFKDYQVFITTTDAHTLSPGVHTLAL